MLIFHQGSSARIRSEMRVKQDGKKPNKMRTEGKINLPAAQTIHRKVQVQFGSDLKAVAAGEEVHLGVSDHDT